jgi:5-methylcytosine-specific restriction protein A
MPVRPPTFRPRGQRSRQEVNREADRRRGSARQRGYGRPWDKASKGHLSRNPFCRYCALGVFGEARTSAASLTDHLYPQRTYPGVFWRTEWWVESCSDCHDGPKQALERKGRAALDALARQLALPVLGEGEG